MEAKENYYQGVDRTILIDLKDILKALERKKEQGVCFSEIDAFTYAYLKELFSEPLHRPFLQGDNTFSFVNEMDKTLFITAVAKSLKYIVTTTGISDSYLANRLRIIAEMNNKTEYQNINNAGEFANGSPIDVRNLTEEESRRAVSEFSEGSKPMGEFLFTAYKNRLYTFACCKGHECPNGTQTSAYISFLLDDAVEEKKYLMNAAFEAGMAIAIIDFEDGLGFNIMLSPCETGKQIEYLTKCVKEGKRKYEMNSALESILNYMEGIGHTPKVYSAIEFFRVGESAIGIEESTPLNKSLRGVFRTENVIQAYNQKNSIQLKDTRLLYKSDVCVNPNDVARSALNMAKKRPGFFSSSMKVTLDAFMRIMSGQKEKSRDD